RGRSNLLRPRRRFNYFTFSLFHISLATRRIAIRDAKFYQRLRFPPPPPPSLPPPPPRRRSPPPPPRGPPVLARASSILIFRPFRSVSLSVWIAVAASAASAISTKPK